MSEIYKYRMLQCDNMTTMNSTLVRYLLMIALMSTFYIIINISNLLPMTPAFFLRRSKFGFNILDYSID